MSNSMSPHDKEIAVENGEELSHQKEIAVENDEELQHEKEIDVHVPQKELDVQHETLPDREPVSSPGDLAAAENLVEMSKPSSSLESSSLSKNDSGGEIKDLEKGEEANSETEKSNPLDPNVVDFTGPDDPLNPLNWTPWQKWSIIAVLSTMTTITPLASSMFAPGVPDVLSEFSVTDSLLGSFVVSVYVLGYAMGPLVIAPLCELYGRSPLYHCTNVLFIIFTVACAVASNMNMLIGFRFLEGCAGSAVITMGGGTAADLFRQHERGKAIAVWSLGPLIGPVIGPVCGGFLSQAKGWRWVFWVIAIGSGAVAIACIFILHETYPPIILERKTARLRKETGNQALRSKMDSGLSPRDLFKRTIVRPVKMLIFSPIVLLFSLHMAVNYGYLYLLFTTITEVFENNYGFSAGVVGLTYLGLGIGMFIGLILFGVASDYILKKKSANGEMKPEYRLPPMIPASFLIPAGLFIYGWSADKGVFWFVPILGTCLIGLGIIGTFMPIQTYIIDAYTLHAASAIAALTVIRSTVGALLPLAGPSMYATLGLGWGNSLLGFIAVAMLPIPFLFYRYGERIRKSPRFQVKW